MKNLSRWIAVAAIGAVLFGCGGSGSSNGTISGQVISNVDFAAPVYVLAITYENRGMVRKIETERMPYASFHVAAYTRLERPGRYTIAGLEDGEYILWAWQDKNGNGEVEHMNFAEPVGWYQSGSNLAMNKVSIANGNSLSGKDITLYQPTPLPNREIRVTVGSGGGLLRSIKGNKILLLWGSGVERARAMGRILAPQILDWINFVLVEHYARSADFYENRFLATIRKNMGGLAAYRDELQAVVDGMADSGTDLYSFRLRRNITIDDIKGINSFYTLPMTMMFGPAADTPLPSCSSAVVWGDRTDNSELGRGLIHGKNMDGENDLRKITVNDLLIVAVDPAESEMKQAIAINWPGFIGMDMGMNESGLILAPHSAMSVPKWGSNNMLDNDLIYRETLQKTATPQEAWEYWRNSGTVRVGGFNTAVSGRYLTSADYPSLTFETDSYGGQMRDPVFMDPKDPFSILTTNTFYKYKGVNPEAVSFAQGYRPPIPDDDHRYWAMMNTLNAFTEQGKTIGTAEMIKILQAASRTRQYDGITEYSFIGYPDAKIFALAKEDLEKKILEAPYGTFVIYDFNELFDRGK